MDRKRKIKYIINIMIIGSVLFALMSLLSMRRAAASQAQNDSITTQVFVSESDESNPITGRKVDFEALKRLNKDVVGWLYIPDTRIDYPIMQSGSKKPEDYYLKRDLYEAEDKHGSIYIQKNNAGDFSDDFTVLYGHKMRDGSMFASVHDFKEESFIKAHNKAYIYTPNEVYVYSLLEVVEKDASLLSRQSLDLADQNTYIALSTCGFPSSKKRVILIGKKDM